jgi:F420-dependent oxidoreductase-like protein
MTTNYPVRFGIKTAPQHTTYEEMLRVWREADAIPVYEHAWVFDHFMPIIQELSGPCLEGWTVLAALAAQTERLRVGVMVTGNTYRHPALLAKMAATVDHISRGRLDFGIGAGWFEPEHAAYGLPLYSPGERIDRLAESCEVIRRMWTEEAASFDGRFYQLNTAYCQPRPVQQPHLPIVIGGNGEKKTLGVVAQYANIWNYEGTVEDFRHKSQVLGAHCAAIGRNPATIERSVQERIELDELEAGRERLRGYILAGATHIIIYPYSPFPEGLAQRLAEEVVEPLLAEFASGRLS